VGDIINMKGDWALAEWYPNYRKGKGKDAENGVDVKKEGREGDGLAVAFFSSPIVRGRAALAIRRRFLRVESFPGARPPISGRPSVRAPTGCRVLPPRADSDHVSHASLPARRLPTFR